MEFVHSPQNLLHLHQKLEGAPYSHNAQMLIQINQHVILDQMFVTLIKQLLMEQLHHSVYPTHVSQKLMVLNVSLFPLGIYHPIKFVC